MASGSPPNYARTERAYSNQSRKDARTDAGERDYASEGDYKSARNARFAREEERHTSDDAPSRDHEGREEHTRIPHDRFGTDRDYRNRAEWGRYEDGRPYAQSSNGRRRDRSGS